MRNVRLFVNNIELDILNREEYDIQIWKQVFNINNLSSRSGEYTRTIKLPTSSTNNKFFGFVNRTDISKPLATGYDAHIEIDGTDILVGKLDLISCDLKNNTISCSMYAKSISWATAIGDKSLQELNFTPTIFKGLITAKQINLDLENTNSPFTHNNLHDIIFPIISFGNFFIANEYDNQPAIFNQYYRSAKGDFTGQNPVQITDPQFNIFDNDEYLLNRYSNSQFKNTDLPPSIYFGNTIRQIFQDANINVQCKLFGDDEFERLIIPPTSDEDGFNWAYLARGQYDSDFWSYLYAVNFITLPVLPKQVALDNDIFFSQLYTQNLPGNTGFASTRTVELEQYLGNATLTAIKLCGFLTATTVQNNYTQLALYPDSSYQVTDLQIDQNRDFNLYYSSPKDGFQRPIEYICPVDGHYTITIEYVLHATLECNPPGPLFGPPLQLTIEADPDLYDTIRRSAIIVRKVDADRAMGYSDYHILKNGYVYVPYPNASWPGVFGDDSYIGHELVNAPAFNTIFYQNNNLTFDAFCKRGERIQIYYVQSVFLNQGTNQYLCGYINNEFQINLVQIDYVSPILEIGNTLSAFEQIIFDKKSDVLLRPELFLPDIKQIDLVKEFIKLFNLYASFDETSNTVVLDTYADYYLPAKNGIDISHLCDFGEKRILNENSIRQLTFAWKEDTADYYFNSQGFNYNLTQINNNNNSANQVEQTIQLDFFAATAFKDYKIWYATKNTLGEFGFLPDALFIYQREVAAVISLPTYAAKETLAQADNSATPPNFKYAMKLIKVKAITKLSNINFVQPSAIEAFPFATTTYRRSGGTPMRVFDPDNRCEIDHWSRSLDSEALDNWQFYIECEFANTVNNSWSLNWNNNNGLYQTFWNVLTQIYFNSYAYWINVYLPAQLYKELNSCRKSVFINGDNFIIQEIRGYSILTEKLTQLVLIKR